MSVDTFNSKNDVFVAIAQPGMENCMVLEWDHIEMNFRSYDNITGGLWLKAGGCPESSWPKAMRAKAFSVSIALRGLGTGSLAV